MESEVQVREQLHGPPAIKTANYDRRKIAKIFICGGRADAQLARPVELSKEAGKIDCNRGIGRRNNLGETAASPPVAFSSGSRGNEDPMPPTSVGEVPE
jgi:hypothetical protein